MQVTRRKDLSWWQAEWSWLSYCLIFSLSFVVLLILQSAPVFADPDSFYHAKMAILIRDQGIVHAFPWLQLTTLGAAYTDQHLLYHILLIPFVTIFPPLLGMKMATVIFGSLLFVAVYWFLRTFGVRWAFLFPLILLFIRPFTFRISLAKAPSTSLIFLIIGLAWIFRFQLRRLFFWSFAYVWYYGGFPLMGMTASVASCVSALMNRLRNHPHAHRLVENVKALARPRTFRVSRFSQNWAVVFVVAAGLLSGLILNPYFPKNFHFYEQQLINIGVINQRSQIGVGAEWYPYDPVELLANGAFASILILVAILGIIFRGSAQTKRSWTLLVLTIFFFLLTLKSRRYVEYYIPIAILFSASSISDSLRGLAGHRLIGEAKALIFGSGWAKAVATLLAVYFVLGLGYVAGRDFVSERQDLQRGFGLTELAESSRWLKENTPAGSRVVHSDWDEFPLLFYHNTHNTYIVGLDPTFLYKADPDVYWTWVNITLGKYEGDMYQAVTEKLGGSYVFLTNDHTAMETLIRQDKRFHEVYQDSEAKIFSTEKPQPL